MNPRPLPFVKRDPRDKAPAYPLDQPWSPPLGRRPVRPKQQVVATVIGELKAGGAYVVLYNDAEADEEGANALYDMLGRLGKRFNPPATFHLLPQATGFLDLTQSWRYKTPPLLPPIDRNRVQRVYEGLGRS